MPATKNKTVRTVKRVRIQKTMKAANKKMGSAIETKSEKIKRGTC